MKKILMISLIAVAPISAFARGGYYYSRTSDCAPGAMAAELDRATARGRAVITTVRCDGGYRPMPTPIPCR